MNKSAFAVSMLVIMLIQAFSASLLVLPESENFDGEFESTPMLSSGNNSSSSCGYDTSLAQIYAYSNSLMFDIGESFNGSISTYCAMLNESMMINWDIENVDTNTTLDSGSFNWTAMFTYDFHNVTSTSLQTAPEGNYTFNADFSWYNNTSMTWEQLGSDTDSFMVYNHSNLGGNGSGNGSSGCGQDVSFSTVSGYSLTYMYNPGTNFTGSISSYCLVTNETYMLDWSIVDADNNNTTIDSANITWSASSIYEINNVSSTSLSNVGEGNYSFNVELSWYNSSSMTFEVVDSDIDSFIVYNLSSGGGSGTGTCGDDPFYSSVYAFTDYYFYGMDETLNATISTYCGLVNESLMVSWEIFNTDSNTSMDSGNHTWTATQHDLNITFSNISMMGWAEGNYSFDVTFEWYNNSSMMYELLDSDQDTFGIMNMTNGGGSGGCGNDAFFATVFTYADALYYGMDETFNGTIYTYCGLINESLMVTWEIMNLDSNTSMDSGNYTWTATQADANISISNISMVGWAEGNYSFDVTFEWYNSTSMMYEVLDSDYDTFGIFNMTIPPTPTGCGEDTHYSSVFTYVDSYFYDLDSSLNAFIMTNCAILNETMILDWQIVNTDTNSTMDSGMFNWTAMQTYEQHNLTSISLQGFPEGNYTFFVTFEWYNSSSMAQEVLDSDSDAFTIYNMSSGGNHSSDCGTNLSYTNAQFFGNIYNLTAGDVLNFDIYFTCLVPGVNFMAEYDLTSSGVSVDSGNYTWNATNLTETLEVSTPSLSAGSYSLYLDMMYYDEMMMMWVSLGNTTYNFTVADAVAPSDDNDGDGFNNTYEQSCNSDPADNMSYPIDTDGDGLCDYVDSDDDNDGVEDSNDAFPLDSAEAYDFDLDGIGDNQDTDDDNDGVDDVDDAFPFDASESADADGDGVGDNSDPCVGVVDCAGVCNGGAVIDECGICGGDGSSCAGNNTGNGTGGETGNQTGGETGNETGNETGGETGNETGGETGNETGGETGNETGGETGTNVLPNCEFYVYIDTEIAGSPAELEGLASFEAPMSGDTSVSLIPGTYKLSLLCTDADGDMLTMTISDGENTRTATQYDGEFYVDKVFEVEEEDDFTEVLTFNWDDGTTSGEVTITFTTEIVEDDDEDDGSGLPSIGFIGTLVAVAIGAAFASRREE